jgi:hypothetical protein
VGQATASAGTSRPSDSQHPLASRNRVGISAVAQTHKKHAASLVDGCG